MKERPIEPIDYLEAKFLVAIRRYETAALKAEYLYGEKRRKPR